MSAGVIASALTGADQDAGIGSGRWLAHVDIDVIVMEGDFAGDGDAAGVRAEVEGARREAEGCREPSQARGQ
jgi:hypothetical protein